jgi:hypothetical protein
MALLKPKSTVVWKETQTFEPSYTLAYTYDKSFENRI